MVHFEMEVVISKTAPPSKGHQGYRKRRRFTWADKRRSLHNQRMKYHGAYVYFDMLFSRTSVGHTGLHSPQSAELIPKRGLLLWGDKGGKVAAVPKA